MARRLDSKLSAKPILTDHLATLVDAGTGKPLLADYVEQYVLPLMVGVLYFVATDGGMVVAVGAALTAASGLMTAYLLQLSISMYERSAAYADAMPPPTARTRDHSRLLDELAANAAYAALVSLITTGALIGVAITTRSVNHVVSAVAISLLTHLGALVLLVLRRVFLLGRRHRFEIRTGALQDHDL